jgi:hypothetical protein
MKINLNEIKSDIRNEYDFMEYEQHYYNGELTIIIEKRFQLVTFHYVRDAYSMTFNVTYIDIAKMSYKELTRQFNENLFYNFTPIEE